MKNMTENNTCMKREKAIERLLTITKIPENECWLGISNIEAIKTVLLELKDYKSFKQYWDELYGKGLEISNWHENGEPEPFDNFYDSALEEGSRNR